jgi:antitoxin YefM
MMEICSYTHARQNLAEMIDKACKGDKIVIHRQGTKPVIMLSLEEYEQMDETAYLLSSPANAKRLYASLKEAENGDVITYDSLDDLKKAFIKNENSVHKKSI